MQSGSESSGSSSSSSSSEVSPSVRDPLSLQAVTSTLLGSVQPENDGTSQPCPEILDPPHLILLVVRACCLNVGFQTPSPSTPSTSAATLTFTHPQSALTFVLKATDLPSTSGSQAGTLILNAVAVQDGKIINLTIPLGDFLKPSHESPYPIPTSQGMTSESLIDRFTSPGAFRRLIDLIKVEIIQKWIPSLYKPGYAESGGGSDRAPGSRPPPERSHPPPYPPIGIFPVQPTSRPVPGGGIGGVYPPHLGHPYGVGDVDLDPFAAGPSVFPRLPVGGMHPGGGMFVGPDHPMFQQPPYPPYGGMPPFPGRPRLPPGAVPPGARFDPIGPFDPAPRPGSGRPPMGRPPFGGGGVGPFSGDPDNDEAPPPGYNDNMFM